MLVIQPIGGKDDWEALFHEAVNTEHYACTSDTPCRWKAKRLGDNAVTEGWAMLMQHLVTELAWAQPPSRNTGATTALVLAERRRRSGRRGGG